jgi:acyl dehydratase
MSATDIAAIPAAPVPLLEGDTFTVTADPLTRTDFVRYAGAGGDFHPLHHDETYAHAAGLPSVFAMGMLHGGMLGVHLARWAGPENLRTFAIRFTGLVWPGDELTFTGRVERVEQAGGARLAHLALTVTRQTGDDAIRATATAVTSLA